MKRVYITTIVTALLVVAAFSMVYSVWDGAVRVDALKVDDEVVTIGGIHGIVRDVQEHTVLIETSPSVTIKLEKTAIARVKSK